MRFSLLLISVMYLLVGCSKTHSTQGGGPEVEFATADNWGGATTNGPSAKGFETVGNEDFNNFGVMAYHMSKNQTIDDVTPNFMYDQRVDKVEGYWLYNPIKYWPNNVDDKLQFVSYFPHCSDAIVLSGNDVKGYPTLTVTPREKPYYQRDLVFDVSDPIRSGDIDQTTGKRPVIQFAFRHKMAQARIYVAHCGKGGESDKVQVVSMSVSGFAATGILYHDPTNTSDPDGYTWQIPTSDIATYKFDSKGESRELAADKFAKYMDVNDATIDKTDPDNYAQLGAGEGQSYMMLIPQDNIEELLFSVLFTYQSGDSKAQAFQNFKLERTSLAEGEIKIYLLCLDPTKVGFGTINITSKEWTDEEIENSESGDGKWQFE